MSEGVRIIRGLETRRSPSGIFGRWSDYYVLRLKTDSPHKVFDDLSVARLEDLKPSMALVRDELKL